MTIKTIYLTGQNNFGNRGCEALVRSTVTVLTEQFGPIKVLVPSLDPVRDAVQWPGCSELGVEFVKTHSMPRIFSKWAGACQKFPLLHKLAMPVPNLPEALKADIQRSDILLSIGGDNYSLDYGLASLYYFCGIADYALSLGKPAVLWGASVGPFSKDKIAEARLVDHLKRLTMVSVRESKSIEYLAKLGVSRNVTPVIDSAFAMTPEPIAVDQWWPREAQHGVLGLNIGALIDSLRVRDGKPDGAIGASVAFVKQVLAETDLAVLLVPHVAPLAGGTWNSDEDFNTRLLSALGGPSSRLAAVPGGLNAAQLKHVISQCRFLIAGRTHATVAAFSTGVPTVSIAYSVKAKGINRDLFDTEEYVLETPKLSEGSLWEALLKVQADEIKLKALYDDRLPAWRIKARAGAKRLAEITE